MDNTDLIRRRYELLGLQAGLIGGANSFLSRSNLMLVLAGILLPILIPFIQFGLVLKLWDQHAEVVNRDSCSNSCWDTVFKGGYETGAGIYKHIYFNATWQSWVIWATVIFFAICLYESVKYITLLAINKQLRYRMALVFLSSVYPHYYSCWVYFNYFNDDFYDQFWHQTMFSVSEGCSTLVVLWLCDKGVQATPQLLVTIITIATSHVCVSGWDQFVSNVLLQEGFIHQVMRDVGFMVPDLIHIFLPIQELKYIGKQRRIHPAYLISNKLLITAIAYVAAFWVVLSIL